MSYEEDNWEFEIWESKGCNLCAKIQSPAGREAHCCWVGSDSRLSTYRTKANIEWASTSLRLSEKLVDRLIRAFEAFASEELAREPEFDLIHI